MRERGEGENDKIIEEVECGSKTARCFEVTRRRMREEIMRRKKKDT